MIDVLAETLRAVRLAGSVFLNGRFTEPFGLISPRQYDWGEPLSHLRHVSVFHLIAAGGCTVELASGNRRHVSAGDVLLVPFADEHRFWGGNCSKLAYGPDLMRPSAVAGLATINHGGGGPATRMVCGFIESAEFMFAPALRSLPELIVYKTDDNQVSRLIVSTMRQILALADEAAPGTEIILGRLMESLFIEVIRHYARSLPEGATGWFAALHDPIVGRALQVVHADPMRRWTVDELAREVGTSRTVLAGRFNDVVGQPPIEYITRWRMQLAAERLRTTSEAIAAVAAEAGYESEAAFNRAFKRVTGITPGAWRQGRNSELVCANATRSGHISQE